MGVELGLFLRLKANLQRAVSFEVTVDGDCNRGKVRAVAETTGSDAKAIHVTLFGMSDMGRVRKNNEDNLLVCNLTTGEVGLSPSLREHDLGALGSLFMVADGMGGEASGEEPPAHRLRRNCRRTHRVAGVGFDKLLEDIVGQRAVGGAERRLLGSQRGSKDKQGCGGRQLGVEHFRGISWRRIYRAGKRACPWG